MGRSFLGATWLHLKGHALRIAVRGWGGGKSVPGEVSWSLDVTWRKGLNTWGVWGAAGELRDQERRGAQGADGLSQENARTRAVSGEGPARAKEELWPGERGKERQGHRTRGHGVNRQRGQRGGEDLQLMGFPSNCGGSPAGPDITFLSPTSLGRSHVPGGDAGPFPQDHAGTGSGSSNVWPGGGLTECFLPVPLQVHGKTGHGPDPSLVHSKNHSRLLQCKKETKREKIK